MVKITKFSKMSKKSNEKNLTTKKKSNKRSTCKKQIVHNNDNAIKKHDVLFDVVHLKNLLYSDGDFQIHDVANYLNKFFFRYGSKIFYDNGKAYECLKLDDAKRKIPDEYSRSFTIKKGAKTKIKEIKLNSYFTHELFLSTHNTKLTIDYTKDIKYVDSEFVRGFEVKYNCLNMKKDLPINYNRKVEETEYKRDGVNCFFNHIKSVICSNDEDEYDTTIKFLASSVMGHKVKIALLWQSKEQTGKGTILNFLNEMLGDRMYKTSDSEQVEKYTKNFEGCCLLNFDELPVYGIAKQLQDKLKALITEKEFDCRAMYQQSYIQKNTFNIVITSNNNSVNLTQSNNVRYFVNTINDAYIGKTEYFDKLHEYLQNEDIKVLIFKEFEKIFNEEVKPNNWIGNNLKATRAGTIKRIDALPMLHKYIKTTYLKESQGIDEITTEFIQAYKNIDKYSTPNKVGSTLKEFGVKTKKYNTNSDEPTYRKYEISFIDLRNYFSSKGWIDEEYDEIPEIKCKNKKKQSYDMSALEYGVENIDNIEEPVIIEEIKKVETIEETIEEPIEEPIKVKSKKVKSIKKKKPKKETDIMEIEIDDLDDFEDNLISLI